MKPSQTDIRIRTERRPGDLEAVADLHREVYAHERGFDSTFATYVAGPLAEFDGTRRTVDRRG